MTERIKINQKDVKVGDFVKLDGYGRLVGKSESIELIGEMFSLVTGVFSFDICIHLEKGSTVFRKSSILSAEREVEPEPKVKLGTWKCANVFDPRISAAHEKHHGANCRVLRSTGWSSDERSRNIKLSPSRPALATGYGHSNYVNRALEFDKQPVAVLIEAVVPGYWVCSHNDSKITIHERNLDPIDRRKK